MSGRTPDEGRYSKVSRRMWNDQKFRELSKAKPNGQTLWQRLLTGPELGVIPGLYAAREVELADKLEWPLAAFRKCWKEIASRKMAEADWSAGLVWVPNGIVHNAPNSTNAVLSWRLPLRELPECKLKVKAVTELRAWCEAQGPKWVEAFDMACADPKSKPRRTASETPPSSAYGTPLATASPMPSDSPSCIQEQEQDQEQDQEQKISEAPSPKASPAIPELQRQYAAWSRNIGAFALDLGHTRRDFLDVWFAWCKPFGITEGPVITQRIDSDIIAIVHAFAAGRTVAECLAIGKAAENDPLVRKLRAERQGGPSVFTPKFIRQLTAKADPDVPESAIDPAKEAATKKRLAREAERQRLEIEADTERARAQLAASGGRDGAQELPDFKRLAAEIG